MPGIPGFEQVPRYRELVDRLIAEDAEFVPPGLILELDRYEWSFLKRELWWASGPAFVAANVGNFGRMQINNPAGSNRLVVVRGMLGFGGAIGDQYDISTDGALIVAGVLANTALDARVPLNNAATLRPVASTNAVANNLPATSGIVLERTREGPDDIAHMNLPFVILPPGGRVEMTQRLANTGATFLAWGYERAARAEELAA